MRYWLFKTPRLHIDHTLFESYTFLLAILAIVLRIPTQMEGRELAQFLIDKNKWVHIIVKRKYKKNLKEEENNGRTADSQKQ